MIEKETLQKIQTAIQHFSAGDFSQNAINLFAELGYDTSRSNPLAEKSYAYFKEHYPPPPNFNAEKALTAEWKYVDILFQLSDSEISNQNELWDNKQVDNTIINSYVFVAVGLSKNEYTRSRLAQICREINKIFPMPVLVLFKYGGSLTLSVIDRRVHKRHSEKDVLEKVTLIKNISTANPHRAHIEIIASLAMKELQTRFSITNFVELHTAWRGVLNIDALNKAFYKRLVEWYEICLKNIHINLNKASAILGKDMENELKPQAVIRVIIRMLFMWFMKEKHLIKPDFFNKTFAEEFLKHKNTYYNAVLQNLFFAVLNKKIDERRFRKSDTQHPYDPNKNDYGVSDVFRFYELFKEGKADEFLELTKTIPFVNGGLFTCHDYKFSGKDIEKNRNVKHNYIIDGFSDNIKDRAIIDDEVLFALIDLFNDYVFTIEESTPLEQDIALDPELLGMAFENLIGFYNPETRENARKQTGSFYTPREIVDYMCGESLKEALKTRFPDLRTHIDDLIDNNEDQLNFPQKNNMIAAITDLKILDPACGSGAFPMGMFTLMVRTIEKLQERKTTYKNKLDIIQNCIYGVDIQNIAVEITKLRFFISLLVDYETPSHIEDFDVLPNLETKFVVANTLIGIDFSGGDDMFQQNFMAECKTLTNIFTPFTTAKTPEEKTTIKNTFETEKERLLELITKNNFLGNDIDKIRAWNPFNVCYCSPFFDSALMFCVGKECDIKGFDVVIGNPPYGASLTEAEKKFYKENYISAKTISGIQKGSIDSFALFIENGFNHCKFGGSVHFIVPMSVVSSDSMSALHNMLFKDCKTIKISSYAKRPKQIFNNACTTNSIIHFVKTGISCETLLTTKMNRWHEKITLEGLIDNLQFVDSLKYRIYGRLPKIGSKIECDILNKFFAPENKPIKELLYPDGNPIYYRAAGGRYFNVITNYSTGSSQEKSVCFSEKLSDCIGAVLSSTLFWWYQQVYTDGLHIKSSEIELFRIPADKLKGETADTIKRIYKNYLLDIEKNALVHSTNAYVNIESFKEYKIGKSKYLIDQIDDIICPLYGLTKEEIEFVKNYEIEFRVGEEWGD